MDLNRDTYGKKTDLQLIGAHEGMEVLRRSDGFIIKSAQDEHNIQALLNEARILKLFMEPPVYRGEYYSPNLYFQGANWTRQVDVGIDEGFTDGEAFRRNFVDVLYDLRHREIRHGDCTSANTIIRNNFPHLIDWQESHLFTEPAPQKQPWSDAFMIWRTIAELGQRETGENDAPRVARRWLAILRDQGAHKHDDANPLPLKDKTFLDLGCFQGDFVAAAACEGMWASGLDRGGFRAGEDSIKIASERWVYMDKIELIYGDVMDQVDGFFGQHIVVMFSTWAYILAEYGYERAKDLLVQIVYEVREKEGTFYFETQLHGDGPGPEMFKTDDDVKTFFEDLIGGDIEPLVTVPVTGRPQKRTVWKVT